MVGDEVGEVSSARERLEGADVWHCHGSHRHLGRITYVEQGLQSRGLGTVALGLQDNDKCFSDFE